MGDQSYLSRCIDTFKETGEKIRRVGTTGSGLPCRTPHPCTTHTRPVGRTTKTQLITQESPIREPMEDVRTERAGGARGQKPDSLAPRLGWRWALLRKLKTCLTARAV
jgi:hypothetical protein